MTDTRAASSLAAARLLALYALSLVTASSAELAWRVPHPVRLVALAVLPGLAIVLGQVLTDTLSAVGSAGVRRRARLLAFLFAPLPTLLASLLPWGLPGLGADVAGALGVVQLPLLVLSDSLGLEGLVLWNALGLAIAAAAGGTAPGAVAFGGLLALAGAFFALDHVTTRLAAWPGTPVPPLAGVLRDALRLIAFPLALLVVALPVLAALAGPSAADTHLIPRGPLAVPAPEARRAYEWLIILALAGAGTLLTLFRWLGGRGEGDRPLVEKEETHVEAEELLEAEDLGDPRYAAARGRVIRAYVRFIRRARHAGLRLEASLTPREIEGRVRRPEAALGRLTGLFMDARYGPDEPDLENVREAEAASRVVCASLATRRSARRRAALR